MNERLSTFDSEEWRNAEMVDEVQVIDVDDIQTDEPGLQTIEDERKIVNSFEKPPQVVQTAANVSKEPGEFAMEMPCDGQVIAKCSIDDLVYCDTMNDWRTHNGIDIAGKVGTQVKAAESGIVSKVYKDELLGVVVVINHENDISSIYANLQSEDFIKVGTEVKKGDIIGGIGNSGSLEVNLEPHLHFEVMSKGEYKNPESFMK